MDILMKSRYISILMLLLSSSAHSFAQKPRKLAIPNQQVQDKSLVIVKEVYKGEYETARNYDQKIAFPNEKGQ